MLTSRPHISLPVADLDAAVHFYSTVFDTNPTKRRDDYANFRLEEPPLHLALVQEPNLTSNPPLEQHFGIELFEHNQLRAWQERVVAAGLVARTEESVTCCYAVADKFWLQDPDGNEWEFWVRTDEADSMHQVPSMPEESTCCAPSCCS